MFVRIDLTWPFHFHPCLRFSMMYIILFLFPALSDTPHKRGWRAYAYASYACSIYIAYDYDVRFGLTKLI